MQFTPEQEQQLSNIARSESAQKKYAPECTKNEDELEAYDDNENNQEIAVEYQQPNTREGMGLKPAEKSKQEQIQERDAGDIQVAGPKQTAKKTLVIFGDRVYGLFHLKFKEGGELPVELQGSYTSVEHAQSAINAYKAKRAKEFEETQVEKTE